MKRFGYFFLFVSMCLGAHPPLKTVGAPNGYAWESWTEEQRNSYLEGYFDVAESFTWMCREQNCPKSITERIERHRKMSCASVLQYRRYLDDLYRFDPKLRSFPIRTLVIHAVVQVNDTYERRVLCGDNTW